MAWTWESLAGYGAIELLKTLILVHISVSVMLYMYYVLLFGGKGKGSLPPVSSGRPVLLITAHPDDECMFFSPFILSTTRHGPGYQPAAVHVLCLTNGNYYGQGKVREKEIIKSCEILGIPADHVSVINNSRLPDDPKAVWDTSTLESQLFAAVNRVQPQHIVTFDNCGVSGHGNHITVSKAVRSIFQGGNSFKGVESVYYLESISLWRKYLGILDLPFTYLYSSHVCLLSPANILRGQRAMLAHWSQLEWFRGLYIMLSRYMIVNSFTMEHRTQHWPNDRIKLSWLQKDSGFDTGYFLTMTITQNLVDYLYTGRNASEHLKVLKCGLKAANN